MTSLKLFYRRGAPAALLLGLIVGAPDIAQAQQLWSHFQPPPRTSAATQPIITPRTSSGSSVAEDNAIVKVPKTVALAIFVMNTAIVAIMGLALHRLPRAKPARRTGILCIG